MTAEVDHTAALGAGQPDPGTRSRPARFVLPAALAGLAMLWLAVGGPSREELQRVIDAAGLLGPVLFIGIYVAWTVLMLPGVVPTLAGGALFGAVIGSVLAIVGAVLGATAAFLIARRIAGTRAGSSFAERPGGWVGWIRRHGFLALLYVRLVPLVPFNLLNYAAGLAGMPTRTYLAATALGIVPGTIAYATLGSTSSRPGSLPFIAALIAVALLTLVVTLIARHHGPSPAVD